MADVSVDTLSIEITAKANSAKSSIKQLASTCDASAAKVDRFAASMQRLSSSLKVGNASGIGAVASAVQKMSGARVSKTTTDNLARVVSAVSSVGDTNGISAAARAVESLGSAKVSKTLAGNIDSIISSLSGAGDMSAAAESLGKLKTSLTGLSELPKSNLSSYVNSLAKLPDVIARLDATKLDEFQLKCKQISAALGDLPQKLSSVSRGLGAVNKLSSSSSGSVSRVSRAVASAGSAGASAGKSLSSNAETLYGKLSKLAGAIGVFATLRNVAMRAASALGSCISASNDYIENMNLADTAMGSYAQAARDYADRVNAALSIDTGSWLRSQGTFMSMAQGMGVAADSAYTMSQGMTQLGYDLSSFFNIDVDEAMQKIESGLSGEIEPMRRLGFDLSETRLQQEAYNAGITESVSNMTQAQKAMLRYKAMLNQITWAQGDMAKTIQSPANMLRVLSDNVSKAARSIGNVFLPMLQAILPVAVAATKVVANIANMIADLTGGNQIASVDYNEGGLSGVGAAAEDAASGIEDAGDAASGTGDKASSAADKVKELKRELMGFDEINKFSSQSDDSSSGSGGSGGSSGSGSGSGGSGSFDVQSYDFIGDGTLSDEWVKKIEDFLGRLWAVIEPTVDIISGYFDQIKKQWDEADVLGAFADAFVGAVDLVSSCVGAMARVLGPVLVAFNIPATLEAAFGFVAQLFTTLADIVEQVGVVLGTFSEAVMAPIAAVMGEAVRAALRTMTDALKGLSDWINSNGDTCRTIIAGICGAIAGFAVANKVIPIIKALPKALDAVDLAMDAVKNHGDSLATAISGVADVFPQFSGVIEAIPAKLGVFANAMVGAAQGGAGPLSAAMTGLEACLAGSVAPIAAIVAAIGAVVAAVAWWVTQTEEGQRTWEAFVSQIGDALSSVVTPVKEGLASMATAIGDVVSAIMQVIGAIAKLALGALASAIGAVAKVAGIVLSIFADLAKLLSPLISLLAKLAAACVTIPLGVLSVGIKAIAGVINTVISVIKILVSLLSGKLTEGLNMVVKVGSEFVDGFLKRAADALSPLTSGISSAVSEIGNLCSSVVGAVDDFFNWSQSSDDVARSLFGVEEAQAATVDSTDEASDALSEYDQKVQDNIESIESYDDANGTLQRALEQTGWSTQDLAKYLADTDQTVDEFVSGIEDYADSVINSFQKIDTESQISLNEMVGNLESNIQTTANWSANLEKMMAMTGLDSSNALVQEMISGGPEKYAAALDEIVGSDENAEKFRQAAEDYGTSLVNTYGATVSNGAATAQSGGEALVNSTATGMENASASATATAQSVDQQTVAQFGSHYGEASDAGRNLTGGFGDGVAAADMVALAVSKAQSVCQQVATALNGGDGYALAVSAGSNMVGGYGDGIASATSAAVSVASSCMGQVIKALNGGAGYNQAKSAGANLMGGYKDGLSSAVGSVVSLARNTMDQVNSALGSGNGAASSKGSGMMTSFRSGLQSGVSGAVSVARSAAQQVQSGMGSNYNGAYSAGSNEMWGFRNGLASVSTYDTGRSAALNAQNGVGSNYWGAFDAGKNFMYGFNDGMVDVQYTCYRTARAIANNCVDIINSALSIHSPSRVTRKTGEYFSLGLALGIADQAKAAYSEVSDVADGVVDALDVTKEVAGLGRSIGEGFGDGMSSALDTGYLSSIAAASGAISAEASRASWGVAAPRRTSHEVSYASSDDNEMMQTIASAVAQGVVSVQMANNTAGTPDTTIVLRVGNEELARAVAKGNDSLARRGVVRLS